MPELPEIETLRRQLQRDVAGATIERVAVRWPRTVAKGGTVRQAFARAVRGARIESIGRRGKNLLIHLGAGRTIVAQMRMTGQLLLADRARKPDTHTHLIFFLEGAREGADLHLRDVRKFARFFLTETNRLDELPTLAGLGAEPFDLSGREFAKILEGRSTRIKPLLLDQRRIAGLGNIYVDESLFAARIHPHTPAGRIDGRSARSLHRAILRILKAAIDCGGSSIRNFVGIDGRRGGYRRKHKVYRRAGRACPRCAAPIERIVVSGRGTHLCPACQREPVVGSR